MGLLRICGPSLISQDRIDDALRTTKNSLQASEPNPKTDSEILGASDEKLGSKDQVVDVDRS